MRLMTIGRSPRGDAFPPSKQKPTPVGPLIITTSNTPDAMSSVPDGGLDGGAGFFSSEPANK